MTTIYIVVLQISFGDIPNVAPCRFQARRTPKEQPQHDWTVLTSLNIARTAITFVHVCHVLDFVFLSSSFGNWSMINQLTTDSIRCICFWDVEWLELSHANWFHEAQADQERLSCFFAGILNIVTDFPYIWY